TSTFYFDSIGKHRGFDYTRSGNPTRSALEQNLAALEGGKHAAITCTGMSAITSLLMLFKAGDHIVAGNDIYGGTYRLLYEVFTRQGLEFSFVDMRDSKNIHSAVKKNTRCIWVETPSNPLLNIVDIEQAAKIGRENNLV